jgi:hypothetical protein
MNNPLRALLLTAGVLLVLAAIFWPFVARYFGRLPGDVVVRRPGFTCSFPIVTSLVLSVVLSLLLTLLGWLFRK